MGMYTIRSVRAIFNTYFLIDIYYIPREHAILSAAIVIDCVDVFFNLLLALIKLLPAVRINPRQKREIKIILTCAKSLQLLKFIFTA